MCVCLLSTESFNTSRQSIVRGAMFGPVSLLKDALHRAVRAKSGEVNKTKPRVPLICCCFFFFSPPPHHFFFYCYDLFPLGFVVFGVWLRGRMASFGRIIAFCQTFLEAATKQNKKKTPKLSHQQRMNILTSVLRLCFVCACVSGLALDEDQRMRL